MSIRVKVRLFLLLAFTLTGFYIASHVYRFNDWFAVNPIVQEEGVAKEYAVLHPTADRMQVSEIPSKVKKNTIKPSIETTSSNKHAVKSENDYQANLIRKNSTKKGSNSKKIYVAGTAKKSQNEAKVLFTGNEKKMQKPAITDLDFLPEIEKLRLERIDKIDEKNEKANMMTVNSTASDENVGDEMTLKDKLMKVSGESRSSDNESEDGEDDGTEDELLTKKSGFRVSPTPTPSSNSYLPQSSTKTALINVDTFQGPLSPTNAMEMAEEPSPMPAETLLPQTSCEKDEDINGVKSSWNSKCKIYSSYLDTCEDGKKYFNEKSLSINRHSRCPYDSYKPICYFQDSFRVDDVSRLNLKCDHTLCHGNHVKIGLLSKKNGKVNYIRLNNSSAIPDYLKKVIQSDKEFREFVVLKCNGASMVHQILRLPPLIMSKKNTKRKKRVEKGEKNLNINIILLDSLSRKHFYRTLKNTVAEMRKINKAKSNPNMVLDFQTFQSLAPFTFVNVEALFSGKVDFSDANKRRYHLENFFNVFKKSGYQTLFQEDTCWYDEWGSILTGNRPLGKHNKSVEESIWKEIMNLTAHYGVDSFGMTHMMCGELERYKITNIYYGWNEVFCANGKILSSHFIDYILDDLMTRKITPKAKPLLSYTHINVAHEISGKRIVAMDNNIQAFISLLSQSDDTLTIFLSDHGGKTTKYSTDTLSGRYEVYDSFLFMIVPKRMEGLIGKKNFKDLINSQNSLMSMLDLHSMLLTLNKIIKDDSYKDKGNFVPNTVKHRSSCQSISMRNYALCKCFQNITFINSDQNNKDFLTWLGEFAMGYLNNKLASQQNNTSHQYSCSRLIGKSIKNVVERRNSQGITYLIDIITEHSEGNTDIFNFQILLNSNRIERYQLLEVVHWTRISIYSRYSSCRDKNVSHEICVCSNRKSEKINLSYTKDYKQFNNPTEVNSIMGTECLYLLKRTTETVATFEVANTCPDRKKLEFSSDVMYSWEASRNLPIEVSVNPNRIEFLVTFMKAVNLKEDIHPKIIVKQSM